MALHHAGVVCALAVVSTFCVNADNPKPAFIPNTQNYSDKAAHPATGRSGSASIQARALLGKDGNTDVEVTTATLDATPAPPGHINKVQLKSTDRR